MSEFDLPELVLRPLDEVLQLRPLLTGGTLNITKHRYSSHYLSIFIVYIDPLRHDEMLRDKETKRQRDKETKRQRD